MDQVLGSCGSQRSEQLQLPDRLAVQVERAPQDLVQGVVDPPNGGVVGVIFVIDRVVALAWAAVGVGSGLGPRAVTPTRGAVHLSSGLGA